MPQQIPRLGHLASFLQRSYPTCNFWTIPCKKQARIYPAPFNSIQLRLYPPPQSYKSLGFQPRWKRGCFLFIILFPVSIPVLQHNKHSVNIYQSLNKFLPIISFFLGLDCPLPNDRSQIHKSSGVCFCKKSPQNLHEMFSEAFLSLFCFCFGFFKSLCLVSWGWFGKDCHLTELRATIRENGCCHGNEHGNTATLQHWKKSRLQSCISYGGLWRRCHEYSPFKGNEDSGMIFNSLSIKAKVESIPVRLAPQFLLVLPLLCHFLYKNTSVITNLGCQLGIPEKEPHLRNCLHQIASIRLACGPFFGGI